MTAERYFSVLTAAIREVDPNHLILGCRFMGTETADDTVWTVAGRHCDVVSVNVYPQVDVTGGRCWADRGRKVDFDRRLDDLHRLAHRPLLISEWSFAGLDTPLRCKVCAAQKFPSQVARAEAATFWMDRLEAKPYVVGWEFFMWTDDPVEGYSRTWPEDANFGLVNVEDEPYREMVAAFEGRQSWCPRFSRAGYWEVPGSPRKVTCLNGDWQFSLDGFKTVRTVAVPHCIDEGELPLQASGGVNRRQPAWYRRQFVWRRTRAHSFLHVEAAMGKSRISVNGRQVGGRLGGFLPIHLEITDVLREGTNTIEVWCDNSDDPSFLPGKSQDELDFVYFGGLYRDVWLVETGAGYVADASRGGVRMTTRRTADDRWTVEAAVSVGGKAGTTTAILYDGKPVSNPFEVIAPQLWSPDKPSLHLLEVRLMRDGQIEDSVGVRFGIRDLKIDGQGLTLNGRPFRKVFGVNRHQDFAFIGMALSNSLHWRDAKKYREAGFTCVRSAHYPQDPAFLDACDELGLFVIETAPGWQFWNGDDPAFAARALDDIRELVRRDRNRPSILMWEPILNETRYPASFSAKARETVRRETSAPNYCAADLSSAGADAYDVVYLNGMPAGTRPPSGKAAFYREWGDCVDDWNAQNSPSRVDRGWGETPQLVQAAHYLDGRFGKDFFGMISSDKGPLFGGCLWHGADHARGYHPDNFLGGVLTYLRQKKYSYHAFKARLTECPYVFLANELTPFSPSPVTVYSNVPYRATWLGRPFADGCTLDYDRMRRLNADALSRGAKNDPSLRVRFELPDSTVVERRWARRLEKIVLALDTEGLEPVADGSDLVVLTATLADRYGTPRRYATECVRFSSVGPVEIVGENPQVTRFGEAAVLLRLKNTEGPEEIRVRASLVRSGVHLPSPGELTLVPGRGVWETGQVKVGHDVSHVEADQRDFGLDK